ncbi:MAG TPA: hypothetical protein VL572_08525 [Pyrinomonadaceae bacterium]|nr:hypothetical protein [Pyrinomonadaceae bacterium]
MAVNFSSLSEVDFRQLEKELDRHDSLRDVLAWADLQPKDQVHPQLIAEVITQDEFTHDVIMPFKNVFLVYDTT